MSQAAVPLGRAQVPRPRPGRRPAPPRACRGPGAGAQVRAAPAAASLDTRQRAPLRQLPSGGAERLRDLGQLLRSALLGG